MAKLSGGPLLNAIADMHSKKKPKAKPAEGSAAEEASESAATESKEGAPPDSGFMGKKPNPFKKGKK